MMVVGLLPLYVFVFQSEYVTQERAESSVCDEWRSQGRDLPGECSEGLLGSFRDILVGDATTKF